MVGVKKLLVLRKKIEMVFHNCLILYTTQILVFIRLLLEGFYVHAIFVSNSWNYLKIRMKKIVIKRDMI